MNHKKVVFLNPLMHLFAFVHFPYTCTGEQCGPRSECSSVCLHCLTKRLLQHSGRHQIIYSCPMKTHHSSDVHICYLLKGVQNCIIHNYYLGQMQCFRAKNFIQVTPLTHDATSASKLRYSHFRRIQKDPKVSFKSFLFASRSPAISPQL